MEAEMGLREEEVHVALCRSSGNEVENRIPLVVNQMRPGRGGDPH